MRKLVHPVGFIVRKFVTMHAYTNLTKKAIIGCADGGYVFNYSIIHKKVFVSKQIGDVLLDKLTAYE
jgi:hypothetical protein